MSTIAERLGVVRAQITQAERASGRAAGSVQLIAVSKLHPASAIREAYAAGQRDFGENYVQELVDKATELADLEGIRFHLIGHLQSNKAKLVVKHVAFVHSVDSASLASELGKRALALGRRLPVLIQVSLAGETQKSGCTPEQLYDVVRVARANEGLDLRGLMTIPPLDGDASVARPIFARLRALLPGVMARGTSAMGHAMGQAASQAKGERGELSMGMSHDLESAVAEGATMVRVGTAIFGERPLTGHAGT